jgi:N-acetyl-alpha-D-muramate 1-phosphate uridylyltransferase
MKPDAIMIFAAGLGLRMGALTKHRPKPLVEVAGRPLLAHALDLARAQAIGRIVVNTHAHADQMQAWLAACAPDCEISHEPERLETGGGLKQALPLLGGEVAYTLNADMVWHGPNPLELLASAWHPDRMDALLCLIPRGAAVGHVGPGDFFLRADGGLTRRDSAPLADFVYSGCQILKLATLDEFPLERFSLNRVWDRLLEQGRLCGVAYGGRWVDVGRPESIGLAGTEFAR